MSIDKVIRDIHHQYDTRIKAGLRLLSVVSKGPDTWRLWLRKDGVYRLEQVYIMKFPNDPEYTLMAWPVRTFGTIYQHIPAIEWMKRTIIKESFHDPIKSSR